MAVENDLFNMHPALGQFILFRANSHLFDHLYAVPLDAGDEKARALISHVRESFDYESSQACNSIYRWVNRICGWRVE